MSEENKSRWWEFYGVRYAQGSVIGALIVYGIFSQNPSLRPLLFIPNEAKDFGFQHLAILLMYGLVYCYLASAPILVFHAARAVMSPIYGQRIAYNKRLHWIATITIALILCNSAYTLHYYGLCNPFAPSSKKLIGELLGVSIVTAIFFIQFKFIFHLSHQKSQEIIIEYIESICKSRSRLKNKEYIETYRHLREHGNSFLIVALEFYLAIPMWTFLQDANSGISSLGVTTQVAWHVSC